MRRLWIFLAAIMVAAGAGYGSILVLQYLVYPQPATARPLGPGEHEIAFIAPATSNEPWERLVEALKGIQRDWHFLAETSPKLNLDLTDAFLAETAAIPQMSLYLERKEDSKVWIRWYKLSSDIDQAKWVKKLQERGRPPLAIIGGDTSGRALELAQVLQSVRDSWSEGSPPLFLITTATADSYSPEETNLLVPTKPLMDVYDGRMFRFCFTNAHMAAGVLDFLHEQPQVWESYDCQPQLLASTIGTANSWGALGMLAAAGHCKPVFLYAVTWSDDRYSVDLAERFLKVFVDKFHDGNTRTASKHQQHNYVRHGVGDYFQANPHEEIIVELFLNDSKQFHEQHELLVLPTGSQRARRFLRRLCRRAPLETHNLVVATGDSISLNTIFRDRELAWNILDLPVPLVFFSHRNPIDRDAGFLSKMPDGRINTTGTQDLLLYRDILEAMIQAMHKGECWVDDSEQVKERLVQTRWFRGRIRNPLMYGPARAGRLLFDSHGNRQPRTGEHVVWLQPEFHRGRVRPYADISVWVFDDASPAQTSWRRVGTLTDVGYHASSFEEIRVDDGK